MEYQIYLWMSVVGGVLLLLQVILQVIGLEHDADGIDGSHDFHGDVDVDADGHGNVFFGVLSFKALVAFVAVFGLTGLSLLENTDLSELPRILYSALAGVCAMMVVASGSSPSRASPRPHRDLPPGGAARWKHSNQG